MVVKHELQIPAKTLSGVFRKQVVGQVTFQGNDAAVRIRSRASVLGICGIQTVVRMPDVHVSPVTIDRGALGDIDCVNCGSLYSDHTSAEWEYAVVRQMQSVPLGSQFWLSEKNPYVLVDPLKVPKGQVAPVLKVTFARDVEA